MSRPDPVLQLVGLAQRGGTIQSGEFSTEKAIKSGKARLVLVAGDASDATKKQFRDMCSYRQVPLRIYGDKETLGHALGKQMRASAAVTDPGLAQALIKKIDALTMAADLPQADRGHQDRMTAE